MERLAYRLRNTASHPQAETVMREAADRLDELDPPPVKLSSELETMIQDANLSGPECLTLRRTIEALEAHDE